MSENKVDRKGADSRTGAFAAAAADSVRAM
jgi:hypothetical protein